MVSRRYRILSGLVIAFTVAVGAVSASGCGQSAKAVPSAVCGGGASCQARIAFLHTADIHSRLLPYDLLVTQVDGDLGLGTTGVVSNVGGVARMATIIDREKARAHSLNFTWRESARQFLAHVEESRQSAQTRLSQTA